MQPCQEPLPVESYLFGVQYRLVYLPRRQSSFPTNLTDLPIGSMTIT